MLVLSPRWISHFHTFYKQVNNVIHIQFIKVIPIKGINVYMVIILFILV